MTRKDYLILAAALRAARRDLPDMASVIESVEEKIADALKVDNPRFDREKFLSACRKESELIAQEDGKIFDGETRI